MKFEPVLDNLIIKPIEEPKMSGAVVLPDTAADKPCKATVIAVGTRQSMDIDEPIDLKSGDTILFVKNAGEEIKDEDTGEKFRVIKYSSVYTKLI